MTYAELPEAERDRLRAAYEAGFSTGACAPWMLGDDPDLLALVDAIANDWFNGLEVRQATHRPDFPTLPPERIPEWLRAAAERETALGDARPPEGWLTRAAKEGKP
jgi:hypothetical protein